MRPIILTAALAVLAAPAAAESWNTVSRSQANVYLADVDSILVEGDATSIKVASLPKTGEAGDLSHTVETYQFRCASGQWRTAGMTEYGADGAETGDYPEADAAWEEPRARSLAGFLKEIACDGARSNSQAWPTLAAFVEAGRP